MRPNVLLVVFDTARADAFEPYGAPRGSTPAVAQLAGRRNGRAHPNAFSTACWTVPAHGSLFTGRLPRAAGLGHVGGGTPPRFKHAMNQLADQTLPAVLQRSGYATAAISANPWISPATGFDHGFDTFETLTTGRNPKLNSPRRRDRIAWMLEALRARTDDGATAVEHLLDEWLRDRDRSPFFWFVNLMECHSPYLPPKPFSPFGPLGRIKAARDASRHCNLDAIWRVACGGWDIADDALLRMRSMYDASIRQLDAWLSRVLECLDEHDVLDDTIVIVTSDHGENLGEGRRFGHAFSLDNRLLHVPLVNAGPVLLDFDAVVSLADVPRVLSQSLDVDDPAFTSDAHTSRVVAVAQLDAEGTPGDHRVDEALQRWNLGEEGRRVLCTSFACATDGHLKLVRTPDGEVVFDLSSDPIEQHPINVDDAVRRGHGERIAVLRSALDAAAAQETDGGPVTVENDASPDEVAALEEQMRLLGYL